MGKVEVLNREREECEIKKGSYVWKEREVGLKEKCLGFKRKVFYVLRERGWGFFMRWGEDKERGEIREWFGG